MISAVVCTLLCAVVGVIGVDFNDEGEICKTEGKTVWKCTRVRECKSAIQMLMAGSRPELCRFFGTEPVVCCEPPQNQQSLDTRDPDTQNISPTTGSKSKKMCKMYAKSVFVNAPWEDAVNQNIDTCNQLESLIVGGKNARPREFPHMAQIGYGNERNIKWKCGGSLISKNYVLSAAHCSEIYRVPAKWVRLGDYNIKSESDEVTGDSQIVVLSIVQRINHPGYKPPSSENDIALYKLEREVEFNEYVRPICLQTDFTINRSYATAIGWGDTDFGGRASDVLQKVNLTLVSQKKCTTLYESNRETLPNGIRESMLCAGDTFSYTDTCQGDSGGPLQIVHPEEYCMYSLIGVTSFGRRCGTYPGVYSRVSSFVPWIESVVWS